MTRDPASWTQLNREFHGVFIRAARSPLAGIVESLQDGASIHIVAALMLAHIDETLASIPNRDPMTGPASTDGGTG